MTVRLSLPRDVTSSVTLLAGIVTITAQGKRRVKVLKGLCRLQGLPGKPCDVTMSCMSCVPSPAAHGLAACSPHVTRPQPKPYDAGAGLVSSVGRWGRACRTAWPPCSSRAPLPERRFARSATDLQRRGTPKACLGQPAAAATCPEARQGRGSLAAAGVPRTGQVGPQRHTRHGGGKSTKVRGQK